MSLGEHVPKLRFPGFEGEIKSRSLGSLCRISTGKLDANMSSPNGKYPFFTCSRETLHIDSYSFDCEAILIAGNGDIGHTKYYSGKFDAYQRTYVLHKFQECAHFLQCAIDKYLPIKVRMETQGGAMPFIKLSTLQELLLPIPHSDEQQEIAKFISLLDSRIDAQRKLVELLKKHKRGLIKRLFQPNEHTKWKSVRLGDVGTFHKGAPLSKADISEDGKPFILYGELYTTYGEIIKDVVRRTTAEIDIPYLSRCGDVIIPTSGETAEEIATASCVMSDGVVLGGDLNIYRSEHIDGRFLAYAVRFIISRDISRIAQGVSVVHISATELKRISVSIPSKDEQIRIVSMIENYDNRILHSQEILMKMETTKDGLLQQLFV